MRELRIAFAGNRDIGSWVLDFILSQGVRPLALLLPDKTRAPRWQEMRDRCSYLDDPDVSTGAEFREPDFIQRLQRLDLDYIFGIHFPYLIPDAVLGASGKGFLNLHPAYLPFNRGWHTPSWGILEGTPAGATLHFMDSGLDTGDIVHRRKLLASDEDTADVLYQKLKRLELEVFREAWPQFISGQVTRIPQDPNAGTFHKRGDLFREDVQCINLDEQTTARALLTRLRALTTSRLNEAAYFEVDGRKHRVQVVVTPESEGAPSPGPVPRKQEAETEANSESEGDPTLAKQEVLNTN